MMARISLKDMTPRERWLFYWMGIVPFAIFFGIVCGGEIALLAAGFWAAAIWSLESARRQLVVFAIFLALSCYYYGWQSWQSIGLCCLLMFELFRLILKTASQLPSDDKDTQT